MSKKNSGRGLSQRKQRRQAQAQAARMKQIRILGLVGIGLALVIGLVAWRNAGVVPAAELAAATEPNLLGPDDAPVRIVEYGDFGCPSCRAWHNSGIREQLIAAYGDQIAFEFRHFPVITAQSPKAAEAGQCAAEQGAFWAYHDFIYEATPQGVLGARDLKDYATAIGLQPDSFDNCLDSGKYRSYVTQQAQLARQDGARGTPSFFINGEPASFSYQGMATMIEQSLAN